MTGPEIIALLSGISGLGGAGVSYGVLRQKVTSLQEELKPVIILATTVAQIAERTRNLAERADRIETKVDRLLDRPWDRQTWRDAID